MVRLELIIPAVRTRRKSNVNLFFRMASGGRFNEGFKEVKGTRERRGGWKTLGLEFGNAGGVDFGREGELRPAEKDFGGLGSRAALKLRFDGPGKRRAAVFVEYLIRNFGIDISVIGRLVAVSGDCGEVWRGRVCTPC